MNRDLARRLAFSTLVLATAAVTPSCKTSVPQPPQAQSAGTRIDVEKASKSKGDQRVFMRVKIWNDHPSRLSFKLGDVKLEAKGRVISPTPSLTKIQNPDVQQNSNATFDWTFDVGEPVGPGTYTVKIIDAQKGGAPLGEDIEFNVNLGQ